MKKFTLLLLLNCVLIYDTSGKDIKKIFNEFSKDSLLSSALVGLKVYNISDKKAEFEYNSTKSFTPASILKLLTTSAALVSLGPDYRFSTYFGINGGVEDHTLWGDLYISGGGDPSLGSNNFYQEDEQNRFLLDWCNELKNRQITTIDGDVILNNSIFSNRVPSTWVWEDIGNHYGSPAFGLTYADNIYNIYFNSSKAGELTKISKIVPDIAKPVNNEVYASKKRSDLAYFFAVPNSKEVLIKGTIPENRNNFKVKGAVPNPSKIIGNKFRAIMAQQGLKFSGEIITENFETDLIDTLNVFESPKLSEIIQVTNTESNNLYAEHLLNYLAYKKSGLGIEDEGVDCVKDFYENNIGSTRGIRMFDGCGLSSFNSISPDQMIELLLYMNRSPYSKVFQESLAIAGQTGTFSRMWRKTFLDSNFIGKSGSFTGVRTYAGYYTNKRGNKMAIVIMMNNYTCKASYARKSIEKLLLDISEI